MPLIYTIPGDIRLEKLWIDLPYQTHYEKLATEHLPSSTPKLARPANISELFPAFPSYFTALDTNPSAVNQMRKDAGYWFFNVFVVNDEPTQKALATAIGIHTSNTSKNPALNAFMCSGFEIPKVDFRFTQATMTNLSDWFKKYGLRVPQLGLNQRDLLRRRGPRWNL